MSPERKRALLFFVLIFLCGALTGAVATSLLRHWGPRFGRTRVTSNSSPQQRAVERFTRRLNLSPEQAGQLGEILDETRATFQEHELAMENLRQEGNARIREILDDQQTANFDEMLERRERRRRRRSRGETGE